MNSVCAKWYDIGMQLRVSVDTLDAIKKQYLNDSSDCLRETLKTWLKSYPLPTTWSTIVDALRSSIVGEGRLADSLKHKYCSKQDTSIAAITPVDPLPVSPLLPNSLPYSSPSDAAFISSPQYSVLPSSNSPIPDLPIPPPVATLPTTMTTPSHHPLQEYTG